jgi:hypothetical protein
MTFPGAPKARRIVASLGGLCSRWISSKRFALIEVNDLSKKYADADNRHAMTISILEWLLGWAWTAVAGGGGFALLVREGPWPPINGWFALCSGVSASPLTSWLVKRCTGHSPSGFVRLGAAFHFSCGWTDRSYDGRTLAPADFLKIAPFVEIRRRARNRNRRGCRSLDAPKAPKALGTNKCHTGRIACFCHVAGTLKRIKWKTHIRQPNIIIAQPNITSTRPAITAKPRDIMRTAATKPLHITHTRPMGMLRTHNNMQQRRANTTSPSMTDLMAERNTTPSNLRALERACSVHRGGLQNGVACVHANQSASLSYEGSARMRMGIAEQADRNTPTRADFSVRGPRVSRKTPMNARG